MSTVSTNTGDSAPALLAAAAAFTARLSGSRRAASAGLSAAYRQGRGSAGADLAAYLTVRLPATYRVAERVLAELAALRPEFRPASLIDGGTGPGTVAWAAATRWPELEAVTLVDHDRDFLALASELGAGGPSALRAARLVVAPVAALPPGLAADLVTSAYCLAEMPLSAVPAAAESLWRAATAMLVLIEPGTPQGFQRLRAAREKLLAQGAVPVAPCPHAGTCPMAAGDWCHFSQRLSRSRAHLHAKAARVPFEDEKFSYLILARSGSVRAQPRILASPLERKAGLTFRLCTVDGLEIRQVARRGASDYKALRKRTWGDLL
jgi:ribosomal protein RSM22 (predicted rRNA methylase)